MKSRFTAKETLGDIGRDARDRRRFGLRRCQLKNEKIVRYGDLHRNAERGFRLVGAAAGKDDSQFDGLGAERRVVDGRLAVGRRIFAVAGGEPAERQPAFGPEFGQLGIGEFEFDRGRTVKRERLGRLDDLRAFFDLCLKLGAHGVEFLDLFDGRGVLGKVRRTLLGGCLVRLVESDPPRENDVAQNAERLFVDRVANERIAALDNGDLAGNACECRRKSLTRLFGLSLVIDRVAGPGKSQHLDAVPTGLGGDIRLDVPLPIVDAKVRGVGVGPDLAAFHITLFLRVGTDGIGLVLGGLSDDIREFGLERFTAKLFELFLQYVEFGSGIVHGGQRRPFCLGKLDKLRQHDLFFDYVAALGDLLLEQAEDLAPTLLALFTDGLKTEKPAAVADRRSEYTVSGECLGPVDGRKLLFGGQPQLLGDRIFGDERSVEQVGTGGRQVVHQIFLARVAITERFGLKKVLCQGVAFDDGPRRQTEPEEFGPVARHVKIAVIDQQIDQTLLLHLYPVRGAEIDRQHEHVADERDRPRRRQVESVLDEKQQHVLVHSLGKQQLHTAAAGNEIHQAERRRAQILLKIALHPRLIHRVEARGTAGRDEARQDDLFRGRIARHFHKERIAEVGAEHFFESGERSHLGRIWLFGTAGDDLLQAGQTAL